MNLFLEMSFKYHRDIGWVALFPLNTWDGDQPPEIREPEIAQVGSVCSSG